MSTDHEAIARIERYLAARGEGISLGKDHIHGFHNAPLLASDLRALIAAILAPQVEPARGNTS